MLGGDKMTKRRFFAWLTFLISFIGIISSSSAQEGLPAIVKSVQPSVVVILTYDEAGKAIGQGSGFFIDKKVFIVTNRHVLSGAIRADVKIAENKLFPIKQVLAEDKEVDLILASVEIPANFVQPLSISSTLPKVGERVVVIGSPLGLEKTVSDGIVSAVRDIPEFGKIIQTTAPISAGSSGSPVVNMKGKLIGIATFQYIEGQNLNFAVPAERIARLKHGKGQSLAEWNAGIPKEWSDSAAGLYSTGISFYLAEKYEKALSYFEEAVKKKPDFADAHYFLGVTYVNLGRYQEAIQAFKQAIRIKPDFADAHYDLGFTYGKLGRYQEAIQAFKQAIRIEPDFAEAHYDLGFTYGKLGRYQEAIQACKQAIRIKPDFAEAHYYLGVTYGKLGRYQEAIQAFKQAIRIKPDDANAHYNLGVTYGKLGRYQEAIQACKQAIRIKPDDAEAHYYLGVVYLILGDKNSALDEYKILMNLDKDLANKLFNLIYG